MPSLRSVAYGGLLIIAGVFVFQACGKQTEGMRCELANGNEDCESNLECAERCGFIICCPVGGATAGTTAECREACTTTATDSGVGDTAPTDTLVTPADTGAAETTAETGGDTSDTDTGADGG